jgi:ribonuclease HIII
VLARAGSCSAPRALRRRPASKLHKGAGAPVDAIGVRIAREHGIEALAAYAKMHFKNTEKIRARLR